MAAALLAGAATLAAPVASVQAQQATSPTEGLNRTGDFRDDQQQQRQGDIRDDARELGSTIQEGAVEAYEGAKEGVTEAYEGARDLVTGDDAARTEGSGTPSAAQREVAAVCARSDLDAAATRDLQRSLSEAMGGSARGAGPVDGICGPRTVAAVRTFQNEHGMAATGVPSQDVLERARETTGGETAARTPSDPATPPPATGGTGGSSGAMTGTSPATMSPPVGPGMGPATPPDPDRPPTLSDLPTPSESGTGAGRITEPTAPASPLPNTVDPATGQPRSQ